MALDTHINADKNKYTCSLSLAGISLIRVTLSLPEIC